LLYIGLFLVPSVGMWGEGRGIKKVGGNIKCP
jgi:hypothetical protein